MNKFDELMRDFTNNSQVNDAETRLTKALGVDYAFLVGLVLSTAIRRGVSADDIALLLFKIEEVMKGQS